MAIQMGARQAKTQANREKLIDVATTLFDQYGYDNVTIDDICERAQMSKGSFYNIFKGKEDLLMLSEKTRRSHFLSEHFVLNASEPYREQLENFFLSNFRYIQTVTKEVARTTYVSYIRTMRGYPVKDTYYHQTLTGLIQRGLEEKTFREEWDAETLYWMLHDWIIGLQIGWSISPGHVDDKRYEVFIHAFIQGILR